MFDAENELCDPCVYIERFVRSYSVVIDEGIIDFSQSFKAVLQDFDDVDGI